MKEQNKDNKQKVTPLQTALPNQTTKLTSPIFGHDLKEKHTVQR